jgi:hypothetical protein
MIHVSMWGVFSFLLLRCRLYMMKVFNTKRFLMTPSWNAQLSDASDSEIEYVCNILLIEHIELKLTPMIEYVTSLTQ